MPTILLYNFILFSSTFFVFLSEKGRSDFERYTFLFVAFLIIFIPAALRYDIGADFLSYINIYNNLEDYTWMEKGFYSVNLMLKKINAHPQWSIVTLAFIFSWVTFRSYPPEKAWIIHFLFITAFYLLSFFIIRQAIAIVFCLWALRNFTNGKYISFVVLIVLGSLFHKSAYFIALVAIISLVPISNAIKNNVLPTVFTFVFVVLMFKSNLLFDMAEFVLNKVGLNKYAGYFNHGKWFTERKLGTGLGVLIKLLFCIYVLYNTKVLILENKRNWLVVLLVFTYGASLVLSAQIIIFGRLNYVFIIALPYAAYLLILHGKGNYHHFIVVFLFILASQLAFSKNGFGKGDFGDLKLNPYQTIFTEY